MLAVAEELRAAKESAIRYALEITVTQEIAYTRAGLGRGKRVRNGS
jgi:hypothetical protein